MEILVPENSTKNNRGLKKLFISTQNIPLVPVLHSDFLEQSVILWHLYFKILSAALLLLDTSQVIIGTYLAQCHTSQ